MKSRCVGAMERLDGASERVDVQLFIGSEYVCPACPAEPYELHICTILFKSHWH